ncbi:hypothetical protein KR009_005825 [Drosophila setifemur]|nr:hypothetical protein KR009_005825 [Drosophila setifemur]
MCKGLGLSCGILAFGTFIACFGALHMLNRIVHIELEAAVHVDVKFADAYDGSATTWGRCQRTLIVENADAPHFRWLELIYMRWVVVFTMLYSCAMMLLLRAKYLSNIEISLATSNAMILVGFSLSVVLMAGTAVIHQKEPFIDMWCNDFIIYYMFAIALTIGVMVAFFLTHSCRLYIHRLQHCHMRI